VRLDWSGFERRGLFDRGGALGGNLALGPTPQSADLMVKLIDDSVARLTVEQPVGLEPAQVPANEPESVKLMGRPAFEVEPALWAIAVMRDERGVARRAMVEPLA
jgi:hypothetical protein